MERFAGSLALLAVLALGAWLALGGRETRGHTTAQNAAAPSAAAQPSSPLVDAPRVAPPVVPALAAECEVAPGMREAVNVVEAEKPARADLSISGRVQDESGAAVRDFTVLAQRSIRGSSSGGTPEQLSGSFRDAGGAFVLEGFAPGTWQLTATAEGHAASKPLTVEVPAAAPLELVVSRAAALRGIVLDAYGAPVAGATLLAHEGSNRFHVNGGPRSDERGAFAIDKLSPGPVRLRARANGWAPSDALELELAAGQVRDGLVLHLRRSGTIAGEVVDPDGLPAAGQSVFLDGQALVELSDYTRAAYSETDAQGHFEFTDLPAGEYEVQSSTIGGLRLRARVALDEGGIQRVRLAPHGNEFVQLHGHVTIGGRASDGIMINANGEEGSSGSSAKSDEDGAYELTVPGAGRYRMFVHRYDGDSLTWTTTIDVPQVPDCTLDVAVPAARVRGRVTDRAGAPLAGVPVRATGEGPERAFLGARTQTGTDGRYELLVVAGSLTVTAGGNDYSADESLTSWSEAHFTGLAVAADQELERIDFALSAGGTLAGRVRRSDGGLVGQVMLYRCEGTHQTALGVTKDDGRFRLRGMEPGTMLVGASGVDSTTPRLVSATIGAGQTTEIELALVGAVRAHVLVHDASGTAAACAITLLDGNGNSCQVNRGKKDGEAWLGLLRAGRYTLRGEHDGKHAERVLEIRGDEKTLELTLTLE